MIVSALNTAVGGMQAASAQLEDAAIRISRAGASISQTDTTTTPPPPGTAPTPPLLAPSSLNSDDLVGGLIDAKLAEISFKASANVFKVADEMLGTLLDITS